MQRLIVAKLAAKGFIEVNEGGPEGLRYLIRIPRDWKPSRNVPESHKPFLFLHGLGMGIVQYASLASFFAKSKDMQDRPIIFLIQPHISMSFFSRNHLTPPSEATLCAGIARMAKQWRFDETGLTVLSHSNGTVSTVWSTNTTVFANQTP